MSFAPLLAQLVFTAATFGPFTPEAAANSNFIDGFAFLRLLRVLRLQRYVKDIRSFRRFEAALGFNSLEVAPYQLEVARVVTSIITLLFISTGLIYNGAPARVTPSEPFSPALPSAPQHYLPTCPPMYHM